MSKEKHLWQRMREKIKALNLPGRWERVENAVGVGIPDVNFCVNGAEGWVELKVGQKPAKNSTKVFVSQRGLTQEQVNWHYFQAKNGGISWVFIRLDGDFYAFPGILAGEINQFTVEDMAFYRCSMQDFLVFLTKTPRLAVVKM